jgi:hypothetical protein
MAFVGVILDATGSLPNGATRLQESGAIEQFGAAAMGDGRWRLLLAFAPCGQA